MTSSWVSVTDDAGCQKGSRMLREKYQAEIDAILSRYPTRRSALLPLLNLAQQEEGHVSETAMKEIAGLLRLTPPQVYEVVTFYTLLNLKPIGKYHIQVCKSLMCALVGSDTLLEWIHARLGIGPGGTTPDRMFSLSAVECLASCGTGPMMQINDDYYEGLTEESWSASSPTFAATAPRRWPVDRLFSRSQRVANKLAPVAAELQRVPGQADTGFHSSGGIGE
jgi:NADH-quinone oxidoreductase subunit E